MGMELSWRLALALMIMTPLAHGLFSVNGAIVIFVSAVVLTRVTTAYRWKFFAVQAVGCGLACMVLIHCLYRGSSFFSFTWMHAAFGLQKTPLDWFVLALTIIWALVFWFGGMTTALRSSAYLKVCQRFDIGGSLLLVMLLMKIVLVHDAVLVKNTIMGWLIILFFLSGVTAIGLSRQERHQSRTFIAGYRLQGVLISVVAIMLLVCVGLLTFLWPCLHMVAEEGYGLFQTGAQTIGPVIVTFMQVIGGQGGARSASGVSGLEVAQQAPGSFEILLMEIMLWGLRGICVFFVITAMVGIGIGLYRLFRWLFSKTPVTHEKTRPPGRIRDWLLRLYVFLSLCREWLMQYIRNYNTIGRIYRALLLWGNHSGVPQRQTETPLEFSRRLSRLFPVAQSEISMISELFQKEIYAGQKPDTQAFQQARTALRRLRSPALWILRSKQWFAE